MKRIFIHLGFALVAVLWCSSQAFAAGTAAGATISNQASVDYEVGGVNQPDVNSNTAQFLVDRRIILTVSEVGGAATNVVPGQTTPANPAVLTFSVQNTSNATIDIRLLVTQDGLGATTAFGDTDSFEATGPQAFVDVNDNGAYDFAIDNIQFIDELPADNTRRVFIVASIPAGQVNGDTAGLTLTAISAQSTDVTGAYVATPGTLAADAAETNVGAVDNPLVVDTVFGDPLGDTDAAEDGRHSDDDEYDVVTASIAVVKSATVVSDPFNGTTNPKAIPGAVIEYCLDVNNTGATAATAIVLTDAIPANTTFVSGSIRTAATGAGTTCDLGSGTAEDDDALPGDEADPNGGDIVTPGSVTIRSPSIAAGSRFKATFRVTVN
ncbi:MAG: hypothetical protein ACKVP2_08720 [Burkholderiales bacterium]